MGKLNNNEKEAITALSMVAEDLTDDELDELFNKLDALKDRDKYFIINVEGKKYKVSTEHAYLEIERLKKNDILKNSINKSVKVAGIVSNVKMYSNMALFCLSPCEINGVDIGHTWVRYSPAFKGVKYNSTVIFYSQIKKYGDFNNKSGVNWQDVSYVRIRGGDNTALYNIPLHIKDVKYAKCYHGNSEMNVRTTYEDEIGVHSVVLKYIPAGRDSFSLKSFKFQDVMIDNGKVKATYNTFDRELVFASKYSIITDRDTQTSINKLLLFEWLEKLEDWEFWGFTNN